MSAPSNISNCWQIARNYTVLRIWWFNPTGRHVYCTTTIRPDKGLSRRERYDELCRALKDASLEAPEYKPAKAEASK